MADNTAEAAGDSLVELPTADDAAALSNAAASPMLLPHKPPLDPRVLRNVITRYDGDMLAVPQCDTPVFHGQGVAVFRTGFTYHGAFHLGRMHGLGRIEWASGVAYAGAFVDNEMQGHGRYTWPNGSSYEGDVVRGRRHGRGVFRTGTRGAVALADYGNGDDEAAQLPPVFPLNFSFHESGGAPSMNAMVHAASNARYEGEWVDGLPHGRGVLVFDDDQHARYEGELVQGKRHGRGEMRYASGNVYVGQWADDAKCGHGTMLWMAAGDTLTAVEKYDGAWRDDRPHGHGRHVWLGAGRQREKNWYEGQFAHGVRHGLGAFFYANGARYEGAWADNAKHGTGAFYYEDGRVFVGAFQDDRAVESGAAAASAVDAAVSTTVSGKILLFIDDLLLPAEGRDKARKLVEHAVLRLNTELRALYRQYIALPAPGSPTRPSASPTRATGAAEDADGTAVLIEYYECRRLLAECGVRLSAGSLELQLQRIRAAQQAAVVPANVDLPQVFLTDPVTLATSLPEVVPPAWLLLFREFAELLVRLAHAQQQQLSGGGDNADGSACGVASLAEAFASFYERLARERQHRLAKGVALADAVQQLHSKELHAVYQKHHHTLQRLFLACGHRQHGGTKRREDDRPEARDDDADKLQPQDVSAPETVAVRALLAQLQDLRVVFSTSFRVRHALLALQSALATSDDDVNGDALDPFFANSGLVFTDFVDALAVVLLARQRTQSDEQQRDAPLFALVDDFLHAVPAQL